MRFFIRALEPEEHEAIHLMIQEMGSGENGFVNSLYSRDLEEFQGKLNRYYEMSQGIGLAEGLVPQTTYWFYDGERPVGYGKLRHRLNDNLLVHGGHIGYAIRPADRNKGYGTLALGALVTEARRLGIAEILLTCEERNIASRRVIEANGGEWQDAVDQTCRYWITNNL